MRDGIGDSIEAFEPFKIAEGANGEAPSFNPQTFTGLKMETGGARFIRTRLFSQFHRPKTTMNC
jgi:hypothetical protein